MILAKTKIQATCIHPYMKMYKFRLIGLKIAYSSLEAGYIFLWWAHNKKKKENGITYSR